MHFNLFLPLCCNELALLPSFPPSLPPSLPPITNDELLLYRNFSNVHSPQNTNKFITASIHSISTYIKSERRYKACRYVPYTETWQWMRGIYFNHSGPETREWRNEKERVWNSQCQLQYTHWGTATRWRSWPGTSECMPYQSPPYAEQTVWHASPKSWASYIQIYKPGYRSVMCTTDYTN